MFEYPPRGVTPKPHIRNCQSHTCRKHRKNLSLTFVEIVFKFWYHFYLFLHLYLYKISVFYILFWYLYFITVSITFFYKDFFKIFMTFVNLNQILDCNHNIRIDLRPNSSVFQRGSQLDPINEVEGHQFLGQLWLWFSSRNWPYSWVWNMISVSFQIKRNMIVLIVFSLIMNQVKFILVHVIKRKTVSEIFSPNSFYLTVDRFFHR